MPIRLVPKSTTLDDLEWPIRPLMQKKHLSEPTTSDPKMHDLELLFRVKFCFCISLAGSDHATFEK